MKALIVCVDFSDFLSVTLPYNRHHFEKVQIVTTLEDRQTQEIALLNNCDLHLTSAFYADGANFNKYKAVEDALDTLGREGWICLMDADVLWPKVLPELGTRPSDLMTPKRRMLLDLSLLSLEKHLLDEKTWKELPLHPGTEFAGYTQIFHASCPFLGPAPWHETNWRHAGGADSFFQAKWPEERKIRPPFEVLHLGPAGENWCGRSTPYLDGSTPESSEERKNLLKRYVESRLGKQGADRFRHEKI